MEAGPHTGSVAPHADAKTRFSDRVEHYVRYRPGYPPGVLDVLRREAGLTPAWAVADVGAGTGISAELFLANGNTVHAVEPNPDMLAAAAAAHGANPRFRPVAAPAEATGLPAASVHLVYCAQAFHWLDGPAAAREFRRIAKPGGTVAVVWNERKRAGAPFLEAYDDLLRTYGTDYVNVSKRITTTDDFARLFGATFARFVAPNA